MAEIGTPVSQKIIEAVDACVEFGSELALDDVTFSVMSGTMTGVVGPNGGGKSTLFNVLAGVQELAHGSIYINGKSPKHARGEVGYVPQRERVNWRFPLSARDVVSLGKTGRASLFGRSTTADERSIEESLRRVEMWDLRNVLVDKMSGGQRQRVFLARALAQGAGILLLDEAFSGVDVGSQEGLVEVLKVLRDEGKCILMATHDLNTLADRFDEVICLNRHVCAQGSPETAFTPSVLEELYGPHGSMFADHWQGHHGHEGHNPDHEPGENPTSL